MSLAMPRQKLPGLHRGPAFFLLERRLRLLALDFAHLCAKLLVVKREQLFSALRRWCRKNNRTFRVDTVAGKGSHVKVYVDTASTIVKSGDLTPVYVGLVLKQLELPRDAI